MSAVLSHKATEKRITTKQESHQLIPVLRLVYLQASFHCDLCALSTWQRIALHKREGEIIQEHKIYLSRRHKDTEEWFLEEQENRTFQFRGWNL
jgi:hypothetical protein